MPKTLTIAGMPYEIVVERRNHTAVYRGANVYARVGNEAALKKDIELHRKMEALGFPVAKLLSEGEVEGMRYFTESSLGAVRMRDIFAQDVQSIGNVSDEHFEQFLSISLKFSKAQIKTVAPSNIKEFAAGIHLETICNERPDLQQLIRSMFDRSIKLLSTYPFVLTHGDFNPSNMYPTGVIDFEDSFHGPLGYDAVTAIVTTDWFPQEEGYEYMGSYKFTREQKDMFIAAFDTQYASVGYPSLSGAFNALSFCRGMWHVVRMHNTPKIQRWRYDRFADLYLKTE